MFNIRFFSDTSFWNQPIDPGIPTDPRSQRVTQMLNRDPRAGLWMNLTEWTIPVYTVDAETPRQPFGKRFRLKSDAGLQPAGFFYQHSLPYLNDSHPWGHGPEFGPEVPLPESAQPDHQEDAHMGLIDWQSGWAWDMWGVRRDAEGKWESGTGMKYRIDGSGVFNPADFPVHQGESIHFYGPSRACGVPAIAGLIMHWEVFAGKIEHKLAFASRYASANEFVYPPAIWTDGCADGGLPQGATLQLDPNLDLESLSLSPAAKVVARALQTYGMVCVDFAGGNTLYGEGLWGHPDKSWEGLLEQSDLQKLTWDKFRLLKMDGLRSGGYDASDRKAHLL